jgi:hypothetical protein
MTDRSVYTVPLAQFAFREGLTWNQAWVKLLRGEVVGKKIGGRWFLTEASCKAFRALHVRADEPGSTPPAAA